MRKEMLNVPILLLTSNVGSMFEEGHEMIAVWLNSLTSVVNKYKPKIVCIHCQEVGGKDFNISRNLVDSFIEQFLSLQVLEDFDRGRIHLDDDSDDITLFTALGTLYMFHKSLPSIYSWDFVDRIYKPVTDRKVFFQDFKQSTCLLRIKYPQEYFPEKRYSRKGYLHSRYLVGSKQLDLVNIHLFHDASNFTARDNPDFYAGKRRDALQYVLNKLKTDYPDLQKNPMYIFGDFNFRLNTKEVIEYLCGGTTQSKLFENDALDGKVKTINYLRTMDRQTILKLEIKKFDYYDMGRFTIQAAKEFRKFDREFYTFVGDLHELPVRFPPSYPYSEDLACGNQFLGTRCPSWCDRIFATPAGMKAIKDSPVEPVYNSVSPDGCVGDHKPVFLSFVLRINEEEPQNGNCSSILDELQNSFQQVHQNIDNAMSNSPSDN